MPSSWPSRPEASTINSAPPTSTVNSTLRPNLSANFTRAMNVIVRSCVIDVQIARPQTHLHPIAAFNLRVGGHRHVEGAVAQPYPPIVDDSVEEVDFRLTQRARHECVRRLAPNLFRCPDLHQRALSQDRDPVAESQCLLIVVGDVDRGGVRHGAKLFELGPHRGAQLGVKMGQRFVE